MASDPIKYPRRLAYSLTHEMLDDLIFCRRFVYLDIGGKMTAINAAVALKLAQGSNQDIVGYYHIAEGEQAR